MFLLFIRNYVCVGVCHEERKKEGGEESGIEREREKEGEEESGIEREKESWKDREKEK